MKTNVLLLGCLSALLVLNTGTTTMAANYSDAVLADGPIAYWRFNDVPPVATNSGSLGAAANGTYLNGATAGAEAPRPPQLAGFDSANTALQLDGIDDFVRSVPMLLNNLSNVTMSGWIRRAGTQRGRTGLWGQDNYIEFGYIDNATVQLWVDDFATPVNVPTPFPDVQWSHLALVVDGNALRMTVYTNGLNAGSAAMPTNFYNSFTSTNFFVIGGDTFGNGTNFNGQIDEVALFNKALSAEQIAAHYFTAVPSAPIITRQPQSTNVFEGADVILSVTAIGTSPLAYQWLNFGSPIPNQTNSTLVFSNITQLDSSIYQVEVSNILGLVLSAEAQVEVSATVPPVITQQPISATRYAGGTVTLTVAATGGSQLDYQWQRSATNIVGATNASLLFNNIQPASAGTYRVIVANAAGSTTSSVATITIIMPVTNSYEALIVSSAPIAYWRLNETNGTTAFDYFGGNDAIYVNSATGSEAPRAPQFPGFETNNLAVELNGTNGYVTGPTGLLNSVSSFTMVGWIRRATNQLNRTGLFGQNDIVEFGYINNNTLEVWTDNGLDISPNPFPNGQWGQVAVVGNGSPGTLSMYFNGGLAGSRSHTLPGPSQFAFNIGGGGIFDSAGNFFNGQIDEVAIFNKALSRDELCRLYTRGSGTAVSLSIVSGGNLITDSKPSGTPHDGSDFGAAWAASNTDGVPVTRTGVMQFVAAEGDQIVLPPHADFNSTQGTIMFWMRSAGTTGGGDFAAMLVDRRSNRGDVIVQADDGTIFVQASDGAGNVNQFFSTGNVNDDHWHHIAYVYNQAGATTIYIDGVQSGSQNASRPWSWDPAQQIELGRSHDGFWRVFNGAMDDFRIYDRILTAPEIVQVMTGALVDAAALKVRFNFDGPPSGVAIAWGCGTLQFTDALIGSGPGSVWTDIPNAISPLVVNPATPASRFYRAKY